MLNKDHIYLNCQFKTQDEIINGLIDSLQLPNHTKECVKQRERSRSTYVPEGIAFPHCHFGDRTVIDKTYDLLIAVATFKEPVMWGANNVNIVILLCSSSDFSAYIKALAVMCKILHNAATREKLLSASTSDEAYQIIQTDPGYTSL